MSKVLKRIYLFLVFAFLYAPILVLMVFSFNEGKTRGNWDGFSLIWYETLFQDEEVLAAVRNTLFIAVVSTAVATAVGTMGAIGIAQFGWKNRSRILALNQVPIINPDIVMAVGLMVLFRTLRMDFGRLTLLLAHIAFTVPYVVLAVLPKLRQMPQALPEAAMDLGATPWQTLWHVVIPQIRPGIITGALIAFTLSIDDFVISFFTTGNGVETVSTMVFSMARRGINPVINALSTMMFLIMLLLLVFTYIRAEKEE